MTAQEFEGRYFHPFFGMVMDAMYQQKHGAEASMWIKLCQENMRKMLREMHGDLTKPSQPPANGNSPAAGAALPVRKP